MIYLNKFAEYGTQNAPRMIDCAKDKPYDGKDKIVSFLENNGKIGIVSTKLALDRITGKRILGELFSKEIDGFSWWSDLAYHVEKYNLRLPKEFEDYVLNKD